MVCKLGFDDLNSRNAKSELFNIHFSLNREPLHHRALRGGPPPLKPLRGVRGGFFARPCCLLPDAYCLVPFSIVFCSFNVYKIRFI